MPYRNDSSIIENIIKIGVFVLIFFFPLIKKIFKGFTDALSERPPAEPAKRTPPAAGRKDFRRESLGGQVRPAPSGRSKHQELPDRYNALSRQTEIKTKSGAQAKSVSPEYRFLEEDAGGLSFENASPLSGVLHDKNTLAQALVMSEIVGRPIALKNNNTLFDRLP